jgi:hypothetical protein
MRFFSYGDMLRTLLPTLPQKLPKPQRRFMAAISEIHHDTLQQVWLEMDYHLTSAMSQRTDTHSMYEVSKKIIFPSVGCMLQPFLPFKCTDFMKYVVEFRISLYRDLSM